MRTPTLPIGNLHCGPEVLASPHGHNLVCMGREAQHQAPSSHPQPPPNLPGGPGGLGGRDPTCQEHGCPQPYRSCPPCLLLRGLLPDRAACFFLHLYFWGFLREEYKLWKQLASLQSRRQTLSAAFKRDREKRSQPLKLILQQREGAAGGAAGQPGPCSAFGTDLHNGDPAKQGWSQPGPGLGAAGGVIAPALLLEVT